MFKKVLLLVLLGIMLIGIVGCGPAQYQPEHLLGRNDSITTKLELSSAGVPVFFSENYSKIKALIAQVRVKFDAFLDEPVDRVKKTVDSGPVGRIMEKVTVIFQGREQMKEYRIIK